MGSLHIRSYVRRLGNITPAQKRSIENYGFKWVLPYDAKHLNVSRLYGNEQPLVLEIGFGYGDATAQIATDRAHYNYLGLEVYAAGVGRLLMRIEEMQLTNLRIIQHDAVEVLQHMIPMQGLAGVHVFFPDPWPKKKHHKRRLLQPSFVHMLAQALQPNGYLYIVTDWQEYAEEILANCSRESLLQNMYDSYAQPQSWRPKTRFQDKGERKQHEIFEIYFQKKP